ncbi:subtilisin-like protease 4 [Triticum dicoccoides]|uniref:subtilisin-like protease 4 n=1 Tax=Triticum dicoccoides TaxID=85692 RepID=UPI000E7951AE|nr:subtilisin-like protease 4 [Triticum dicoccoides]
MASFTNLSVPLLLLAILFPTLSLCYINPDATSVHQNATESVASRAYIVLVEPPRSNTGEDAHRQWHESFLPTSLVDESSEPRLLHSYTEVFSGFAVRLTDAELDAMAKKPGFVRAFPDRTLQLMTTHTPEFLGLKNGTGFWSRAGYGKGVIIGLLDTGLYATHPSFDDHGVSPPPTRWKGSCKAARCNNKLIGAKSLVQGDEFGDEEGHGTHTSSTAAGNFVTGASYHGAGVGEGTAAGIAPGAHIAMYKVCANSRCKQSTVLAGLEEAIKDGVDVLSLSLGGDTSASFDEDPIAIGAFSAVSKGILVVCAAGNSGPRPGSITNEAPWLLTVAAGSVDRSFAASLHLGNGKSIDGEAVTQKVSPSSKSHPLLYSEERRYCNYKSGSGITGKILVCEGTRSKTQLSNIHRIVGAGAAGVVLFNDEISGYATMVQDYNSSVVQVSAADGDVLIAYAASSESSSVASLIYNNTLFGVRPAPVVPFFSSRGPSVIAVGILKPDILAPGLNILAAWPPSTGSGKGTFNIISGTSMATPHVSGVAALIKSIHPDWSPAAIKSAILTTSDIVNSTGGSILDEQHRKAGVYDTGAGHVNPTRAADPGLLYDLSVTDYAGYICWLLGDSGLATIVRNSSLTCAKLPKVHAVQLNYPTITVSATSTPFTVKRTVTNVGPENSTFTAKVDAPRSLTVRVSPETLAFSKTGEKKTFSVSVSSHGLGEELHLEGSLSWVSEKHVVRSPIVAVSPRGDTAPDPSP